MITKSCPTQIFQAYPQYLRIVQYAANIANGFTIANLWETYPNRPETYQEFMRIMRYLISKEIFKKIGTTPMNHGRNLYYANIYKVSDFARESLWKLENKHDRN